LIDTELPRTAQQERPRASPAGLSTPRIAAVVVLYHPDPVMLSETLRRWLAQVDLVLCIDNGMPDGAGRALEGFAPGRLRYLPMGGNAGLGAAHNRGIAEARDAGCSHVVLGDQDSLPGPGMVASLLEAEAGALAAGRDVAAVGPRYVDAAGGHPLQFVRCGRFRFEPVACQGNEGFVPLDFLISSGSLIRLSVLERVGPMDETLFIDHVDTEWCLRAKALGLEPIGADQAWMAHQLGERTLRIRIGRLRTVPLHKPFRYYFIARNSLLLYKRAYVRRSWIVPDAVRLAQVALFFGLLHSNRLANARMIFRGIRDGLRGVTGPGPLAG
jgi:rhamnosyltransferase